MTEKDLLLSIDNGTQSVKALVFDPTGRLLAREQVAFTPYFARHPGWAEQDPKVFWQALCRACQGLWTQGRVVKDRLAGVALTTQRGTVVNVAADGTPLRPAILWLDQRKAHGQPALGGFWGMLFKAARLGDTIAYFQAEAEANWIRSCQPEIWKKTHKYLLLSGYLTYCLTGSFVDSIGAVVGYMPFDYKHLRWAPDWDWKWRALPIERHLLPALVPVGQPLGAISVKAARETGIPRGLPLIAAGFWRRLRSCRPTRRPFPAIIASKSRSFGGTGW